MGIVVFFNTIYHGNVKGIVLELKKFYEVQNNISRVFLYYGYVCGVFMLTVFWGVAGCTCRTPYECALADAAEARQEEIRPLIRLTPDEPQVLWQEGRVLLATWHDVPDIYRAGRVFVSDRAAIWTVSARELHTKLAEFPEKTNAYRALCRLLGRSDTDKPYTHISYVWADPADILRPAYQTDVSVNRMSVSLDETTSDEYRVWFETNAHMTRYRYPWTRLGYTCDWEQGQCAYGLTEFIIKQGAEIRVEKTLPNDAFFKTVHQKTTD